MATLHDKRVVTRCQLLIGAASIFGVFILLNSAARADPSVWGTIYHKTSKGTITQAGDRILLYSKSHGWIGPTFTSDSGYFSFSNLRAGAYSLQIFVGSKSIFNENIQAPTHVKPILLGS